MARAAPAFGKSSGYLKGTTTAVLAPSPFVLSVHPIIAIPSEVATTTFFMP
jgi:hypothetical protein